MVIMEVTLPWLRASGLDVVWSGILLATLNICVCENVGVS